jgi:P-type Ca2+ transporter type 2C
LAIQFQLTVNITAVTLTFISAIASSTETSVLTPVQLLWVNLIMDTFAALALATDPPDPIVLDRKPEPKSSSLISLDMWKMIVGQSVYQLIIVLSLNFAGNRILRYETPFEQSRLKTVVFNSYVWMQFFNQYKFVPPLKRTTSFLFFPQPCKTRFANQT